MTFPIREFALLNVDLPNSPKAVDFNQDFPAPKFTTLTQPLLPFNPAVLPPLINFLHQHDYIPREPKKLLNINNIELRKQSSARSGPIKQRSRLSIRDLLSEEPKISQRHNHVSNRRQCSVAGCPKYALSGGRCIRHGGGKRCSAPSCETVAQSGGLCKAHGGGSRCKVQSCPNVARRRGFCMGHGGRQSCKVESCTKCAHGGGYCISHGGGKRCASLNCEKSAQAGGFCYSHGGGKRCSAAECFQAARKGGYCIRHRKRMNLAV